MTPSMFSVFEAKVVPDPQIPVLKKNGKTVVSKLSDPLKWGVKAAMNSDGQDLPYSGKPPEGSFFFVQAMPSYSEHMKLCMHIEDPKLGKHSNWEWHYSDPEDGDEASFETSTGVRGTGEPMRPDNGQRGMWLNMDESELEDWVREKAASASRFAGRN